MLNVFNSTDADELISRINKLTPGTQPLWGKMSVSQMLAHCNVTYEMMYENKHPKPSFIKRFFINMFARATVIGDKPYKRNLPTAPQFIISDSRDFETEKHRLITYIRQTYQLGAQHFEGKESNSFGKLTAAQWNNMMAKHLEHHLQQFGV